MALPGTTNTILDGGLGVTTPATSRPLVVGACATGPLDTPTLISNQRQLKEVFGTHGNLVDCIGYILDVAGGPVLAMRTHATVAATYTGGLTGATAAEIDASTGGGTDNDLNVIVATSAPKLDADVVVTITTGGARGAMKFTYSLDGGASDSAEVQGATTNALGDTGITLEWDPGTVNPYVAGATYSFEARQATYNSTDLGTAHDALEISPLTFDFIVYAGKAPTAVAGALIFDTVATQMAAFVSLDRYYRAIVSTGEGTAALALTSFATKTSNRVAVLHGQFRTAPAFGVPGRAAPFLPATYAAAARAAGNVMSTDLAQTFGADSVGPLVGASEIDHNEYTENAGLDDVQIGTLRTYANLAGFFLTNVHLKSGAGSDFQYWQHGVMMDQACRVVSARHTELISSNVVCKADGTGSLVEPTALAIEKKVQRSLDAVIGSALRGIGPTTVDGSTGHVSDQKYQVDRTNNVLSTKTLIATVSLVPRGYLKTLQTTLSYKLAV
jgi:hypothetical protein